MLESDAARHADEPLPEAVTKLFSDYRRHGLVADGDRSHSGEMNIANWFAHGNGSCERTAPAGEFTVAASGSPALESVLPTGRYSHVLSTRHRNVLQSPRIELDDDYELWLLVAGEGEASVRYTVQDYPRDGTVYPVTVLKSRQWRWQKYDLSYWRGDSVHVELATASDAPVLARGNERSWFGIRDARLVRKGEAAPPTLDFEPFAALAEAYQAAQPQTFAQLRACLSDALQDAIRRWRNGDITDAQALWFDAWLQAGLLPDVLADGPAADANAAAKIDAGSLARLINAYREIEEKTPLPTRVPGVLETVGADQPLYVRGDHRQQGQPVPRGFIRALDSEPIRSTDSSGRLELAHKLTGPGRALLARVIVNRLWHHLFGRGLVATPDNFGKLGQLPSHPELLDYLAGELIANGWSLKHIIGLIVTSHTWQQTSEVDPATRALDPDNVWLARAPLRRLEAESIRDAELVAAGKLDLKMYGPSVDGGTPRRSIYVRVFRNSLDSQLRVFDFPEPTSTIGRRDVTNVPAQSLMLLNNPLVRSYARNWAEAALKRDGGSSAKAIASDMFRAAFWRDAEAAEVADVVALEEQLRQELVHRESQREELGQKLGASRQAQERLLSPARQQLIDRISGTVTAGHASDDAVPQPIASWEFDRHSDAGGQLSGELVGKAELVAGQLVTRGGFFKTAPLPYPLAAKTLEVWMAVDDLKQRGGGVMSVQTLGGDVFDAIVLGEQSEGQWLAGSNFFARTKPFGGPSETQPGQMVHLAITYAADGRIGAYRNGEPYGESYVSSGLQSFEANQAVITFGCRHLPAGGNKQLAARWERARLYDRALSAAEVAASYRSQPHAPAMAEVIAALSESDRSKLEELQRETVGLEKQLAALGEPSQDSIDVQIWT
ncbi:MAG: DUF1553 domain-containing protein, partial [Aureliella sp.]